MRYYLFFSIFCLVNLSSSGQYKKVLLPNGWTLTPVGKSIQLGDLPLNMAFSPDGRYIAVTNNGVSTQTIQLIDARNNNVLSTTEIAKSWLGLKFSSDSRFLYASCGNDNRIMKYKIAGNNLEIESRIVLGKKWPVKISPAGIDINDKRSRLYVVTKENNSIYIINLETNEVTKQIPLGAEAYTCLLSPDKSKLYITMWGGSKVLQLDTKSETITDSITVGRNPNDMCITHNGRYLFVANSIDNTVLIIETKSNKVIETLNSALYPDALSGSTTNSVALKTTRRFTLPMLTITVWQFLM